MPRGMIFEDEATGKAKPSGYYRINNEERRVLYQDLRAHGYSAPVARRLRDWPLRDIMAQLAIQRHLHGG